MMDNIDKTVDKIINFALKRPELVPSRVLVISLDKHILEKILTPGRMDLIRTVSEKKPGSVGELATLVKRPVESVSRDLSILENYGILCMVRTGRTKKPEIGKDVLMIPLTS